MSNIIRTKLVGRARIVRLAGLGISIGNIVVAKAGESLADIDKGAVVSHLKSGQVHLTIGMGIGRGKARVWSAL